MPEVLAWVLVLSAAGFTLFFVAPFLVARRALRRRNRVTRGGPPAPPHWLVAPDRSARLHRRVVRVCRIATPARGRASSAGALIEREAVAIDQELILCVGARGARRTELLDGLEGRIDRLEDVVRRLGQLERPRTLELTPGSADPLLQLEDRLRSLEGAWAEVERAEGRPS